MVEQKKIIKEDVFEKKKLGTTKPTFNQNLPTAKPLPTKTTTTGKVKEFTEPGRVSDITQQENILLKKKQKVEEVHEKPIVEVHEKPIIKNVKEPLQTKYVKEPTLVEEFGDKRRGEKFVKESLATAPHTKKVFMKPKIAETTEAPIIQQREQIQKEIHNQPVIHEIHEKPVQEIHEQDIVRVVHEKPTITKVKDAPVYVTEDKGLPSMGLSKKSSKFSTTEGLGGGTYGTTGLSGGTYGTTGLGGGTYGTTGLGKEKFGTGGTTGLTSKPKTLKSDFDKGYGGKGDWKKTELYKDTSGDLYKKEYKHKEHSKTLPGKTLPGTGTKTYEKERTFNRESPYSSPSTPSSPSSPSNQHKGGTMHNLKEKMKNTLHIGGNKSHHHHHEHGRKDSY